MSPICNLDYCEVPNGVMEKKKREKNKILLSFTSLL